MTHPNPEQSPGLDADARVDAAVRRLARLVALLPDARRDLLTRAVEETRLLAAGVRPDRARYLSWHATTDWTTQQERLEQLRRLERERLRKQTTRGARDLMQLHTLKTWPDQFTAVADGSKTFEVRYDDRGFAVGDLLRLAEWDPPHPGSPTAWCCAGSPTCSAASAWRTGTWPWASPTSRTPREGHDGPPRPAPCSAPEHPSRGRRSPCTASPAASSPSAIWARTKSRSISNPTLRRRCSASPATTSSPSTTRHEHPGRRVTGSSTTSATWSVNGSYPRSWPR
jgi:hypothetical protein